MVGGSLANGAKRKVTCGTVGVNVVVYVRP